MTTGNSFVCNADDIAFGVELLQNSFNELDFLQRVDQSGGLYNGQTVRNAIRRYEQCWLPLASAQPTGPSGEPYAPPLDVHWIWHCHMLAPYVYEKDCMKLIGKIVDHQVMSHYDIDLAQKRTRQIWEERYPKEPFDWTVQAPEGLARTESYSSKSSYNLERAVDRQSKFYYQVSLPHYRTSRFLSNAIGRYRKFLFLKKIFPDEFLVPCYDFDLVWHTHQLHPVTYKRDTTQLLGRMFNHDDSVNDRSPESKLSRSDQRTRELWREYFREEFTLTGAMYRGDPPFGKLEKVSSDEIFAVSSKMAEVTISSLRIENVDEDQKFVLKVALSDRQQQQQGPTLLKLKGPQTEWQDKMGITRFIFNTGTHSLLQFDLIDKKGFMCFGAAQSCGAHNYPFRQIVENTPSHGRLLTQTVSLQDGGTGSLSGPSVAFTASVDAPQKGPCILVLQGGPFQTYTIPENIEKLWGPIPLPRLPEGVPNTCIVASHR